MTDYTVRVKVFPNNEIRATYFASRGYGARRGEQVSAGGDIDVVDLCCDGAAGLNHVPLDITSKLSAAGPAGKPGYGKMPTATKFGLNGKRTMQRAAGAMERLKIPPGDCVILTGTIPGGTDEAFDAVAAWSSWIVKRLKTWLNGRGVTNPYGLYVWELQKRGALHIHYCAVVPDAALRGQILAAWSSFWSETIDAVGARAGVDCWMGRDGRSWKNSKHVLQADAQIVEKSVAKYLSKYFSKDAGRCKKRRDGGAYSGPVRWWGVSRPLLAALAELSAGFEILAVSPRRILKVWDQIQEGFSRLASKCQSYCDKFKYAHVTVCYDGDAEVIYNELWRDLYARRILVPWSEI